MRLRWLLLCVLLAAAPVRAATLDGGAYGRVHVTWPADAMRGFVVLFSAGSTWGASDQHAAEALAAKGAYVVGVNTEAYLARIGNATETCHHMQGDAEALSHQIERERGSPAYEAPILAGVGVGGRVAESALAEAPVNTIEGAVAIDPAATLDPRARPCPAETTGPKLPGFWDVATTPALPPTAAKVLAAQQAAGSGLALHTVPPTQTEADTLLALITPHLGQRQYVPDDVSDLPLVELPAAGHSDFVAVVISGDGGWRDIDKSIAEALHQDGVSVVGWDALRYFWSEKPPAQTAHDLARVLRAYTARWHARYVALIGYSFGADVMPFAYNRLPPDLRSRVSLVSLLGFAPAADFEIRVSGWLGMPPSDKALPVASEIARVPEALVQCFYGTEEDDTYCPKLARTGAQVIRVTGGHHLGGEYKKLTRMILEGWKQRLADGS